MIPVVFMDKDPATVAAMADIKKNLDNTLQNELLEQYTHYLTTKYPVTINDAVLQTVLK